MKKNAKVLDAIQLALEERVKKHEAKGVPVVCIVEAEYIKEEGYRACVVEAGGSGYRPTGTWPFTGAVGETRPWFWGHDLAAAQAHAARMNANMAVSVDEANLIIARSIARGMKARGGGEGARTKQRAPNAPKRSTR